MLTFRMGEGSRLGSNSERHPAMKDNLLKERSMELEDTFVEMNGSTKATSLTMKSRVRKER